ncbi:MAG: radical SAM family heme chaperone HemW [Sedimentisphaerales bacterium]|nr:radical SAM family heme chaperone HemW [Sedimentisphaerales bacterium]
MSDNSKYISESIGLYVHVPFCRTKCRYCNFYSEPITKYDAGAIIKAMIAEMELRTAGYSIKTLYLGGGSPSSLPRELLLELVRQMKQRCQADEEFTVEINPGQVDEILLDKLHKKGVNRLSIGAQSFIQRELDFLGRQHTADCISKALGYGRSAGFENINLDLIFAVPGSSLDSWKYNLNSAIELSPDHISAYSLTYEDQTPIGIDLAAGIIKSVDEETDRQMYEMTIDELKRAGIYQYEISNFAKDGFECRHNLNYWANGGYIGIGPGATSYLRGVRSTNYPNIHRYAEAVGNGASTLETTEKLDNLEWACESAVLNLRRRSGINLAEFKKQTGFDAELLFEEPIQEYQKLGLIEKNNGRIYLTRKALGIADSILCDFSAV